MTPLPPASSIERGRNAGAPLRTAQGWGGKPLLMIDYRFPPIGGPGVRRTLGLVKHLAEFGWSPVVLTVSKGDAHSYDRDLLRTVPDAVAVERTVSFEPLRFARKLLRRHAGEGAGAAGGSSGFPWKGPRWIGELLRSCLFPDERIGWLPFAFARGLALHRRYGFQAVFSTSGDVVTSHLIALLLTSVLKTPWVADFQDPWVETTFFSPGWRRSFGEWIEHRVVHAADRVTFASEPVRAALQRKYGFDGGKSATLLLGFDPDAFAGIPQTRRRKFTITHFGSFGFGRSPGAFLKALTQCVRDDRGLAQDLEVLFFGTFEAQPLEETEALLDAGGLRGVVRLEGFIPYRVGLEQLKASDLLLIVPTPDGYGYDPIPTKLFDYLGAGRPILAMLHDGAAAEIVRHAKAGTVIHPDDVTAIRACILDRYRRWKAGDVSVTFDQAAVNAYAVREITARFAAILDDLVGGGGEVRAPGPHANVP